VYMYGKTKIGLSLDDLNMKAGFESVVSIPNVNSKHIDMLIDNIGYHYHKLVRIQ